MLTILYNLRDIVIKKDLFRFLAVSIIYSICFGFFYFLTIRLDFGTLWFLWILPFVPYIGLVVKLFSDNYQIEKKKK